MKRNRLIKVTFICVALILVLVILYSGLRILESTVFLKQQDGETGETKSLIRDGVRYFPRQDIVVVMLLGIDRQGKLTDNEVNSGYAADVIALLIFDEQTRECSLLYLNRDSMVMMPGLNEYGKEDGRYYGQLALSHTYGSGLEDSCINTRKTVSNLLYGITIDYYVSMNMDAIAILNDAVGGVTVNVTDDFSEIDPTIQQGEVTLHGQQAVNYVRTRKGVGDQLNVSRMERQKEYIDGFVEAFRGKQEKNDTFILSAYGDISEYLVTDCTPSIISGLLERYSDYELTEIVSPEGENVRGEQHYEFYLDEEKLDELIVRLFYAPVK